MDCKVSIRKCKSQKKYLAEQIGDDFWEWNGKKILISAPTGMGKTTFVVRVLLDHLRKRGKKLLILCNRRLLRLQYWNSIVDQFVSYAEIEECVTIITYQQLAEMLKQKKSVKRYFESFELIVSDECHYFYSDSDFNGFGTYALLQEIVGAGALKTMIFMSATMEEVKPLIVQTLKNGLCRLSRTERNMRIKKENEEILEYDFTELADYSRFHCIYVQDMESMCDILVKSPKKSVIFMNNKEKCFDLMERMIRIQKIEKTKITILNAENMDINGDVVQSLVISNRLLPKILITTAVLDNGVSIHDQEVGNVMIETESKTEFLQMLGRIRSESTGVCNLYFVQRDKSEFAKRKTKYEKDLKEFEKLSINALRKNRNFYLQEMMSDGELAEFYKRALVWMKFNSQFYNWPDNETYNDHLESDLYINEFAKRKIGDMYVAESRFYALAVSNPLDVAFEQMGWIGKKEEELQILESEYRKKREEKFIEKLLSVQKITLDDLKVIKEEVVKEYHQDFFSDILAKNGTISNEKLMLLCERYNLEFFTEENPKNRKQIYTIRRKKEDKTHESK